MNPSLILSFITTITVVCGVIFAALQVREAQHARRRTSMLLLVQSFQTPDFVRGLRVILSLPPGLSKQQLLQCLEPHDMDLLFFVLATWESLGILVYRGELSLSLVSDFFGGVLPLSWQRLSGMISEMREGGKTELIAEWFQWLVECLELLDKTQPRQPAHLVHARQQHHVVRQRLHSHARLGHGNQR
jgi:hypothetical protein